MNKKNQIIMSAASVSAALSAVTTMGSQNQIIETPKSSPYDAAALEAISTAKSQAVVRGSFGEVAKTIRIDDSLRQAIYAEVAQGEADWEQIIAEREAAAAAKAAAEAAQALLDALAGGNGNVVDQTLGGLLSDPHLMDSTNSADVFSCYNNCHSACHGSRGWR